MSVNVDLDLIAPLPSPSTPVLAMSSDELISDLWIVVALVVMVLSCIGCLCTCFLYHTFQQWKSRARGGIEAGCDSASLPSYTAVCGLPTYEEALEQQMLGTSSFPIPPSQFSNLSVGEFLEIYKKDVKK